MNSVVSVLAVFTLSKAQDVEVHTSKFASLPMRFFESYRNRKCWYLYSMGLCQGSHIFDVGNLVELPYRVAIYLGVVGGGTSLSALSNTALAKVQSCNILWLWRLSNRYQA